MNEPEDKPYILRVYIESISPGKDGKPVRNQRHVLEEGSWEEAEHVVKNFEVDKAVTAAVYATMEDLASPYLGKKVK